MQVQALWEISVAIAPEAEEAVAQLVHQVFEEGPSIYREEGSGATSVTVYLPQEKGPNREQLEALSAGLKFIERCGLKTRPGKVTVKRLRPQDWAEVWKRHFKPITVGSALLLKPSWSQRRARKGQAVVVLDPGLSFGTGHHPTTAFCLKQLVAARGLHQHQSFLDIGTGSGVLAIAAAKLGYRCVHSFDVDAAAVRVARANARTNRVQDRIRILRGDLIRLPITSRTKYHLICANLTADVLLAERIRILNRLRKGGRLVLSGILGSEFSRIRKDYEQAGLSLLRAEVTKEWTSGLFELGH